MPEKTKANPNPTLKTFNQDEKILTNLTLREYVKKFWPSLNAYRKHKMSQRWFNEQLGKFTTKLKPGEVLIGLDPSANPKWYWDVMHGAMYNARTEYSLIPVVACWSVEIEEGVYEMVRVSFMFLAKGGKHGKLLQARIVEQVAAMMHGMTEGTPLDEEFPEKYRLKTFTALHIYSDNSNRDMKNKTVFHTWAMVGEKYGIPVQHFMRQPGHNKWIFDAEGGRFKIDFIVALRTNHFVEIDDIVKWANIKRKFPKDRGAKRPAKLKFRMHFAMPVVEQDVSKPINANYVDCLKAFDGCTDNYCFTTHDKSILRMRHFFCACTDCRAGSFQLCRYAPFCGPWKQQDIVKRTRNPLPHLRILQAQCDEKAAEQEPDAPAVGPQDEPDVPQPPAPQEPVQLAGPHPGPGSDDGDWIPVVGRRRRRRAQQPRRQNRPRRGRGQRSRR